MRTLNKNASHFAPRTVSKFAGAPLTGLDPDDLRYLLRHARRDRLLAAAVERELRRRIPRLRPRRAPARRA